MAPPDNAPRRILLDCSDTYGRTMTTGIQRVVRSVLNHSSRVAAELGVVCEPVVFRHGTFYHVDWQSELEQAPPPSAVNRASTNSRRRTEPAVGGLSRVVRRGMQRVHKALFPRSLARQVARGWWKLTGRPVDFHRDDIMLLMDYAAHRGLHDALANARRGGVRLAMLLYDLIPLSHPQFFDASNARQFRRWVEDLVPHLDAIVGISQSTCDAARQLLLNDPPHREMPCEPFPLGTRLDIVHPDQGIRDELRDRFESGNSAPYLCVCTFEPRKNHALLLDAMELVWHAIPGVQLCLAGRIGWKADDLMQRLREHPRLGRELHLFHDLSDAELHYCYDRARAFVFPSWIEGYGLPLAEALQHGLPVLASDTPVHREVGGDFCAYFPPTDAPALARLIMQLEDRQALADVRSPREYVATDWEESTRALLTTCLGLLGSRTAAMREVAA